VSKVCTAVGSGSFLGLFHTKQIAVILEHLRAKVTRLQACLCIHNVRELNVQVYQIALQFLWTELIMLLNDQAKLSIVDARLAMDFTIFPGERTAYHHNGNHYKCKQNTKSPHFCGVYSLMFQSVFVKAV